MLDMSQVERIRDLSDKGYSPSEIKDETGFSYPTIRKYLDIDDFSPKRPTKTGRPSIIDPFVEDIRAMLDEDRHCYRKQRHTAKRIFERLRDEHGFTGSYSTVRKKVKEIREAAKKSPAAGFVRLHWQPGTMQVDFGQADFDYAFGGGRVRMHYFPMSFPHSNHALCEVFGDEKDVCVCQALQDAFERIGGVPPVIILDNATEAGRRWRDIVTESKLFKRFRLHYGFEARFCNPSSGHEKGNVEGKVGYIRRNCMVPVPTIGNLRDYNSALNEHLEELSRTEAHYEKGLSWAQLFEADKEALMPLPAKAFDVVHWETCTADGYGRISPGRDRGCHLYLASPKLANVSLTVGVRAFSVEIDGMDGAPIREYERRTGSEPTYDEDPLALIDLLACKTRAFGSSSVRMLFNEECRAHFDSMERDRLKDQVATMARLMREFGHEVTVGAFEQALEFTGDTRGPDVEMTAARISAGGKRLAPGVERGTRIIDYDSLLRGRRAQHA